MNEDLCSINLTVNLHIDTNARIKEVDEIKELLGDIQIGTFLEANMGELSTIQGSTIDNNEHRIAFGRL
jgi:hypothetical protein